MSIKSFTIGSAGPLTKIRAEQIKAEIVTGGTLASDLLGIKEQVAAIAGAAFDVDYATDYANVQMKDLAGQIDAGSTGLFKIKVATEVTGALSASAGVTAASFDAAGKAHVGSAQVDALNVAGGVIFTDVSGNFDNDANVVWNGSALKVTGELSGSGALKAGGAALIGGTLGVSGETTLASATVSDLTEKRVVFAGGGGALVDDANFQFDISGATDALKVVGEISGSAALKSGGTLDVAGNSALVGTLTVSSTSLFNDNVTVAAGKSLTIGGDLIVNGTTTTVNSTTITVDDRNIELGSVATPTDATAENGGITLKGASDKTIKWTAAKGWEFSEKIEAPSAILVGDLTAVKGIFSGDVSGVKGIFSGDVSGVKGTFSGNVVITGSGVVLGQFNAFGGSALSGVVNLPARSGMKLLVTDAGKNVAETALSYSDFGSGQVDLAVGSGSQQLHIDSGAKKLWSASDLTLSASAGVLAFADRTESIKLSDDAAQWGSFRAADAAYGSATSLLGCFIAIDSRLDTLAAASAAAAKKSVSTPGAAATNTPVVVSGVSGFAAAALTIDNSMVFFNGQLLRSGSGADVAAVSADYSLDGGYSSMKFSFAVEAGDAIVIQKV